jgi:hypothetical protein
MINPVICHEIEKDWIAHTSQRAKTNKSKNTTQKAKKREAWTP